MLPTLLVLTSFAWVPILLRFYDAWKKRRNPVSLAICVLVVLVIYLSAISTLHIMGRVQGEYVAWLMFAFNALVCVNFYVSFFWSKRKFTEERTK